MKPIHVFASTVVAFMAALVLASSAAADQPFDRCLDYPIPGPGICTFDFDPNGGPIIFPAGTRCDFEVKVEYTYTGTIYYFDNPPRAVAHIVSVGTATNTSNGHTLTRTARFTETASPPYVLTDHGLLARYSLPGGGTITVWAGYQQESIDPPLPEVFRGNPPPGIDPADTAAFCAALA
jgi:hypothetical protein